MLEWLRRAVGRIHEAGMLVIPNYSATDDSEGTMRVTNLTDGVLAEVRTRCSNVVH